MDKEGGGRGRVLHILSRTALSCGWAACCGPRMGMDCGWSGASGVESMEGGVSDEAEWQQPFKGFHTVCLRSTRSNLDCQTTEQSS